MEYGLKCTVLPLLPEIRRTPNVKPAERFLSVAKWNYPQPLAPTESQRALVSQPVPATDGEGNLLPKFVNQYPVRRSVNRRISVCDIPIKTAFLDGKYAYGEIVKGQAVEKQAWKKGMKCLEKKVCIPLDSALGQSLIPNGGLACVVRNSNRARYLTARPGRSKRNKGRLVSFLSPEWEEVTVEGRQAWRKTWLTINVKDKESRENNEDRDLWERKKILVDPHTFSFRGALFSDGDTPQFKVSDWRASLIPIAPIKNWDHAWNPYPTDAAKGIAAIAGSR